MKGFYHIWAWRPSWSCDLDFLYTHWFPLPIDASYKIWLWLAKRFQRRRSLKLWTDGRTPDHGHPISSPCEPNDSGDLKTLTQNLHLNNADTHANAWVSAIARDFQGVLTYLIIQGIARTQSPTLRNCVPELPTFGVIAGVNPTEVQWKGLFLGEPPC